MSHTKNETGTLLGIGILAGLAGTVVLTAIRSFDEQYAPRTIPPARQSPGQSMLRQAADAAGLTLPPLAEQTAALLSQAGHGWIFGAAYALLRGRHRSTRSALIDGSVLGAAVYAVEHAGWLPATGREPPAWKQNYPQIAGELFRHIASGIATAGTFGVIDASV